MIVLPDIKNFDSSIRLVQLVGGVTATTITAKLIASEQDLEDAKSFTVILDKLFKTTFDATKTWNLRLTDF
mgnify:FL=1